MRFVQLHPNFKLPVRSSVEAGGLDVFMPIAGVAKQEKELIGLGFKAAVPKGHVAFILPRSGVGAKHGIEVTNTVGVIDSDYRNEWFASIKVKPGFPDYKWEVNDRLLQLVIVPVADVSPELVDELESTERGEGGFGSTGK